MTGMMSPVAYIKGPDGSNPQRYKHGRYRFQTLFFFKTTYPVMTTHLASHLNTRYDVQQDAFLAFSAGFIPDAYGNAPSACCCAVCFVKILQVFNHKSVGEKWSKVFYLQCRHMPVTLTGNFCFWMDFRKERTIDGRLKFPKMTTTLQECITLTLIFHFPFTLRFYVARWNKINTKLYSKQLSNLFQFQA